MAEVRMYVVFLFMSAKSQEILKNFLNHRYIYNPKEELQNYDAVMGLCQSVGGEVVQPKNKQTQRFLHRELSKYKSGKVMYIVCKRNENILKQLCDLNKPYCYQTGRKYLHNN